MACNSSSAISAFGSDISAKLSSDQELFESVELGGGEYTLSWNLSLGESVLSSTNYFYATSTGGLIYSPSEGRQLQTSAAVTLIDALSVPATSPTRVLLNGKVWLQPSLTERMVSSVGSEIRTDFLATDGMTVLSSNQLNNFSITPLTGSMSQSPEELLAKYPLTEWIGSNRFSVNSNWLPGSAYIKLKQTRLNDAIFVQDCANSQISSPVNSLLPAPCETGSVLEQNFPFRDFSRTSGHGIEVDEFDDGTISIVQGVRTWISNNPLPGNTTKAYRTFFELNGNVYMGNLERKNTVFNFKQNDGSVVNYSILLNRLAVQSIQQGLIVTSVTPAIWSGSSIEVNTVDIFEIDGHGVNGSISPADLRTHYDIPLNSTGQNQTIVIVDWSGPGNVASELNVFSRFYGLPECNIQNPCFQEVDLSNGAQTSNGSAFGEEIALDTQMVHAIAPNAKIVLVIPPTNDNDGLIQAIDYAAKLPGVSAISLSLLFAPGVDVTTQDTKFQNYQSSLGSIFLSSSGDGGYLQQLSYPSSSPYVTAVGGTRITSVDWTLGEGSEVAWEFSGGGFSSTSEMPEWQKTFLSPAIVQANHGMRVIPDVSAVADSKNSALSIYYEGAWQMSGGTSASAPIWAGICALLSEEMSNKGKSLSDLVKLTPGGLNALLYRAKTREGNTKAFHEIVSGSNSDGATDCSICSATTSYNDVTGLGSPDVKNLFSLF